MLYDLETIEVHVYLTGMREHEQTECTYGSVGESVGLSVGDSEGESDGSFVGSSVLCCIFGVQDRREMLKGCQSSCDLCTMHTHN